VGERFGRQLKRLADRLVATSLFVSAFLAASVFSTQSAPAADPAPAKLRSGTVAAFDRYERLTEERNDAELKRGSALLWIDSARYRSISSTHSTTAVPSPALAG
jgi:hypothetical protein